MLEQRRRRVAQRVDAGAIVQKVHVEAAGAGLPVDPHRVTALVQLPVERLVDLPRHAPGGERGLQTPAVDHHLQIGNAGSRNRLWRADHLVVRVGGRDKRQRPVVGDQANDDRPEEGAVGPAESALRVQHARLAGDEARDFREDGPVASGALPGLFARLVLGHVQREVTDEGAVGRVELDFRGEAFLRKAGLGPDGERRVGRDGGAWPAGQQRFDARESINLDLGGFQGAEEFVGLLQCGGGGGVIALDEHARGAIGGGGRHGVRDQHRDEQAGEGEQQAAGLARAPVLGAERQRRHPERGGRQRDDDRAGEGRRARALGTEGEGQRRRDPDGRRGPGLRRARVQAPAHAEIAERARHGPCDRDLGEQHRGERRECRRIRGEHGHLPPLDRRGVDPVLPEPAYGYEADDYARASGGVLEHPPPAPSGWRTGLRAPPGARRNRRGEGERPQGLRQMQPVTGQARTARPTP